MLSLYRVVDYVLSRKEVGIDRQGNVYFEETKQVGTAKKRFVKYRDESTPDVHSVPVEWWSWLHYMRDTPPTEEEIASHEAYRARVAEKVAKIEAEDNKQRLRQFASTSMSSENSASGDVQQALQYLAAQRGLKNDSGRPTKETDEKRYWISFESKLLLEFLIFQFREEEAKHAESSYEEVEVLADASEEPKGYGEDFQPGTWKPTSYARRRKE
eukprot:jgi/Galph1/1284/GphlegSOOS_G5989.1